MANEKRLIDAVRLREALDRYANAPHVTMQYSQLSKVMRIAIDTCIELLDLQRTVDAVPVVRCKDCKHGIWDEEEQTWECVLPVDLTGDLDTYSMFHEYNDGEHFCSYGERKDNA